MGIYKKTIKITGLITLMSFLGCLVLHYMCVSKKAEFWCNITLGIFGSSLLTLISSIVGYRVERKRVFEKFFCYTNKILKQINQYQEHMTLEEKIDFLLKYIDTDKIELDSCLGDIDLLFDLRKKKFEYIYNMIYKPLRDLERAIRKHEWHFRWHKDGLGKNNKVMETFVAEIEPLILDKKEYKVPTEVDENGIVVSSMVATSVTNKIVEKVQKELNGKYYTLMYGKKRSDVTEQGEADTL